MNKRDGSYISYLEQYVNNYNEYVKDRNHFIEQTNNKKIHKLCANKEYKDIDDVDSPKFCNYYFDLCIFLNKQEEILNHKKIIKDKWLYLPPIPRFKKFEKKINYVKKRMKYFELIVEKYRKYSKYFDSSKIKVLKINKDGEITQLFLLTSDVFGFTGSPDKVKSDKNINIYPLANYYRCTDKEKYKDTLKSLRTIGGTFIWPTNSLSDKNCNYNRNSGVTTYLEDRVDLKLNEIMHYYKNFSNLEGLVYDEKKTKNYDRLEEYFKRCSRDKLRNSILNTPMSVWLNHFESASNYIDFFKFDDFVKNTVPYDITSDSLVLLNEKDENYYQQRIQNYLKNKDITDYNKKMYIDIMIRNLKTNILKRTKKINAIIEHNSSNIPSR